MPFHRKPNNGLFLWLCLKCQRIRFRLHVLHTALYVFCEAGTRRILQSFLSESIIRQQSPVGRSPVLYSNGVKSHDEIFYMRKDRTLESVSFLVFFQALVFLAGDYETALNLS